MPSPVAHPTAGSLQLAWERPVFECAGGVFVVADIIHAAWLRGSLQPYWAGLLRTLRCAEIAEAERREADGPTLQSCSEEFRYARDLLTVEETSQWLAQRDLTEEAFTEYIRRRYWAGEVETDAAGEELEAFTDAPPAQRELLRTELLLGGGFNSLALGLLWRVLALETATAPPGEAELVSARSAWFEALGLELGTAEGMLGKLGRDLAWMNRMARFEAAYRHSCDGLKTVEHRTRSLVMRRLDLTRIAFDAVVVPTLESAREAALCLSGGELTMAELADECGTECRRMKVFLEDLAPELRTQILCGKVGELLEPIETEGGFEMVLMCEKTEPSLEDPEVVARLDALLREEHFEELSQQHARWIMDGEGA